MEHSSACLHAPIQDQSAPSTPMTQSSEFLTTPRIGAERSRCSTPATSISIPSRPNTPSFYLPANVLNASPVQTTKPHRVLTMNDYATEAHDPTTKKDFPRLSRPVPMMRTDYDVVVIGSGYGGAVAASRSVRANKEVCVLELGKEKHPGEYPECALDALKQLHISGNRGSNYCPTKPIEAGKGKKTDLYNLVLGEGQNAFVAHALGGTSLLNANVFLEADTRTLQLPYWPKEIRQHPEGMKKYYDRAASVLEPTEYPLNAPSLPKLDLLKKQAEAMGWGDRFKRVPQTTTFVNGRNSTGVKMKASQLLGQDCTGVNDGSKNTVLVNYLADAWYNGAEMFCECEVRHVKQAPDGNGWIVFFAWHGEKRGKFKDHFYKDLMWVRARELVFFGAGTLGTTEILLRSKEQGLKMSDLVGKKMSGNGDILAFGYNTDHVANAMGTTEPIPGHPVGPTITGVVDMRDAYEDVMDGFVLEEGAIPPALTGFLQGLLEITPDKTRPEGETTHDRIRRLLTRAKSAFQGAHAVGGALNKTQVYLMMSHDSREATLALEGDKPFLKFYSINTHRVDRLYGIMAELTKAIGGTLVNNPFNIKALGQEHITVHPIGGAIMSPDGTGEEGVVNHLGEIFSGDSSEVHDGLVVVDASIIPCALGVNPFATITALAERCVEGVLEKRGCYIDLERKNGAIDLHGEPAHSIPLTEDMLKTQEDIRKAKGSDGARFSEIMDGFINIGDEIEDVHCAYNAAEANGSTARFYLTIDAWSTRTLVSSKDRGANITGTLICAKLSKDPFMIVRGTFKLFSDDNRQAETKNLVYDFDMVGTDGQIIHFHGYKVINSSIAFSVRNTWTATTTLFVTLTSKHGHKLLGKGKMFVGKRDFATQLQTMQAVSAPGSGFRERLAGKVRFLDFFTRNIARLFFIPFSALQYPQQMLISRAPRISLLPEGFIHKVEPTQTIKVIAKDGLDAVLYYWAPPPHASKSKAIPILFIPGSADDHRMYHLPTVKETPIDYFHSRGHPVYCVVHRTGLSHWASDPRNFTVYDGRLDIAAAIDYIRTLNPDDKLYIIAHCAGSMGLASGLLKGDISPENIAGVTSSSVFCHPIYGKVNRAKAALPVAAKLLWAAVQNTNHYYSCVPSPGDSYPLRALDNILRFYPTYELCSNVVCHRSSLMFGRLWSHRYINEATHRNLDVFIGGISKGANLHLAAMGRAGLLLDNEENIITTKENAKRLKGIDFNFIVGKENEVFHPEGLFKSTEFLRSEGVTVSGIEVLEDRGHLDVWMGSDPGCQEIWKMVRKHVTSMEKKYYRS